MSEWKARILVIDDEPNILKTIELSLNSINYFAETFADPLNALENVRTKFYDIAFIDLKMRPLNGIQVLEEIKRISAETTVVLMTAHGSIETAVDAIKKGAYDYITKPFTHREFIHIAERVFEFHRLNREVKNLKSRIDDFSETGNIITQSAKMLETIKMARQVASSEMAVLIEGESGTGKELLAKFIHENSPRREGPFIAINCAAIPENLFESELFGHAKGSFTGAVKDRTGRLEMADGGTLFLDEVSEIPKQMQVKLLRFLQNMEFERIGEAITRKTNIRVISATNRDTEQDLKSGHLRDDFYYRISGVRLKLTPLRERYGDIPLLVEYFINKFSGGAECRINPEALKLLTDYSWPGNIRELSNIINRAVVFARDDEIVIESLPVELQDQKQKQYANLIPKIDEIEKQHIIEVLRITSSPKEAAKILGISETTLWRKRKLYNV